MSEERRTITLKCGCKGAILEDGDILITDLCPSDTVQLLEMEEDDE